MSERRYSELRERIIETLKNTPWKQVEYVGIFGSPATKTLYDRMADALIEVFEKHLSSLSQETEREEAKNTIDTLTSESRKSDCNHCTNVNHTYECTKCMRIVCPKKPHHLDRKIEPLTEEDFIDITHGEYYIDPPPARYQLRESGKNKLMVAVNKLLEEKETKSK